MADVTPTLVDEVVPPVEETTVLSPQETPNESPSEFEALLGLQAKLHGYVLANREQLLEISNLNAELARCKLEIKDLDRNKVKHDLDQAIKIDYPLREVTKNGATLPKTQVVEGVTIVMPITSAEENAQRRLEVKARCNLMIGIPTAAARLREPVRDDLYRFVDTVERGEGSTPATIERVTKLSTTFDQETSMIYAMVERKQDDQALQRARVNRLFRDRKYHAHTARLMEGEAMASRTAWAESMDASDVACSGVIALRTDQVLT
nr:hypothetical protein [Tanacetum cinerariifolium]